MALMVTKGRTSSSRKMAASLARKSMVNGVQGRELGSSIQTARSFSESLPARGEFGPAGRRRSTLSWRAARSTAPPPRRAGEEFHPDGTPAAMVSMRSDRTRAGRPQAHGDFHRTEFPDPIATAPRIGFGAGGRA